jgi:hypothetical protein
MSLRIACLGWGSLIWRPSRLPLIGHPQAWHRDGPQLPIEFARRSTDGRVTLVVTEEADCMPVLWAEMDVADPVEARRLLIAREETIERHIGLIRRDAAPYNGTAAGISSWALARDFDAVVWTKLPPSFNGQDRTPSCNEVVQYLQGVDDARRLEKAKEYVRRAPSQIATRYRRAIEAALGWTCDDSTDRYILSS